MSSNAWRLLDTVRAFAAEQLTAAGEYADTTARHLAWFADRAADLERRIGGDWRDDFAMVADDLRAALAACPPGAHPLGHKLASALGHLAFARRFLRESLAHYQEAAARSVIPADAAISLSDAAACALFINFSGDDAAELLRAAADSCHEAGDGDGRAVALARAVEISARYTGGHQLGLSEEQAADLLAQAAATGDPGNPVVAAALAAATAWHSVPVKLKLDPGLAAVAERTARATGDPVLICASLDATRTAASGAGRLRDAYRISTERFALLPALDQNQPRAAAEVADMYGVLCTDAILIGDLPVALDFADRSREDDLVGSHPFLSVGRVLPTLALMGRLTETAQVATQIWQAWQRAGSPTAGVVPTPFAAAALAHCLLADDRSAQLWRRRAQEAADSIQGDPSRYVTFFYFVDARCALHTGDLSRAEDVVASAFSDQVGGWYIGYARAAAAELAIVAGLPDAERLLATAALDAGQSAWAAACVDRATWRLGADDAALARSVQGWERIGARYERACTLLLTPGRNGEGRAELDGLGAVLPVRW